MLRPRRFSDDNCPCILTGLPQSSPEGTLPLISPDRGLTERIHQNVMAQSGQLHTNQGHNRPACFTQSLWTLAADSAASLLK
ncbi:uncharacterized [Tachysurus ichikawai]